MGEPPPSLPRAIRIARALIVFGVAYVVLPGVAQVAMFSPLVMRLRRAFGDAGDRVFWELVSTLGSSYMAAIFAVTVLVPLGFMARSIARGRVRAAFADPLDRARVLTASHPGVARGMSAVPALAWMSVLASHAWSPLWDASARAPNVAFAVFALVAGLAHYGLARAGLRALLAPTLAPGDDAKREGVDADEITFDAIAVTTETRAAVAGMAVLPFAVVALLTTMSSHGLSTHGVEAGLGAYVALTLGAVYLFRRASRIAIGVDGVLVKGTSRTRFYAYRDLDDARARGADIELVRGGRIVLRLQLHGEDAVRRDAVLARVRGAIAAAAARRAVGTEILFHAASRADETGRASVGAGDYRQPSPSREQLWEVIEGGAANASARTAAASALAASLDGAERARLRVLAAQCAEPKLRVALEGVAGQDPDADEEDAALAPEPARRALPR